MSFILKKKKTPEEIKALGGDTNTEGPEISDEPTGPRAVVQHDESGAKRIFLDLGNDGKGKDPMDDLLQKVIARRMEREAAEVQVTAAVEGEPAVTAEPMQPEKVVEV